ncbi:UDP-2,3-diacylglucosamine diphosphatase [Shewanella psychropiezotolerans]|uniref:UDP-2,3-diacylglucosamine hydrolase n=1 Tax=Shewanella psychropiezotolerans TaxID=2593655 RepID=A0ABX5X3B2_9GAMM|nr:MULTISPECIES: UDP-2,3-diacylglucosamine diphosphatase [Shewanella]MPY21436.1 UDP-2,3-diacylglucosamine diphosphatase [Shewanella sp. YLB-07]MPY22223.1 UDP-2,3-diacylglucosamine diphosphatase [Shewanella sp. YLB-07]QDO84937.1 UDP-2,3-diacylglucosamine diphosphatase [Shewanella psychropiezotolerans]
MRTLFIGDLHLSADRPDITLAFNQFLDTQLDDAEALYILGDLFEVWTGDDIAEPFANELADKLHGISQNLPIYYIHGNRDFLIGNQFATRSGITLLPELHSLNLYGIATVLLHGDSLCTLDKGYQRFRRFRNNSVVKWIYSRLPKRTRQNIATKIRAKSQASNMNKSYTIMDVEKDAVTQLMNSCGATQMIHGHTHRPDIHYLGKNQAGIENLRIVVGDWYEQGSVLSVSKDNLALTSLPFQAQ